MKDRLLAWGEGEARLTAGQAREAMQSGLVRCELIESPDRWKLVANSRVGIVHGHDWEVRVEPRIPIPKLMFLLGYSRDSAGWKETVTGFREDDLFTAIASGFSTLATAAISPVPLQGYVAVDDVLPAFRGRLRFADQMRRTLPLPLEVDYDDFTVDIPENRQILRAAELLLGSRRIPGSARRRLLRLRNSLDGVQGKLGNSDRIPITRLNSRYRHALALASLIIDGAAVSTDRGERKSIAFVFDLNQVFEDFLTITLTEAIVRRGGRAVSQDKSRCLDREQAIRLIPDLVWYRGNKPLAVVDAKFKSLAPSSFPNADAYQMLAYCHAFRVPAGFLVYARDENQQSRDHSITEAGKTVCVRTVPVELEPEPLLDSVDRLADEIVTCSTALAVV